MAWATSGTVWPGPLVVQYTIRRTFPVVCVAEQSQRVIRPKRPPAVQRTHRKVRRLDVSVQVAVAVDRLDRTDHLRMSESPARPVIESKRTAT